MPRVSAERRRTPWRLLTSLTAGLGLSCALWPHWSPVLLRDSGLVGEWAGEPTWSRGDTIEWRFDSAGTAERSRIHWRRGSDGARRSQNRESLGRWRTYDEPTHAPRRFVCFDYGRERDRLPCWYFIIESGDSGTGRVLRFLGRVGGPAGTPEVYTLTAQ